MKTKLTLLSCTLITALLSGCAGDESPYSKGAGSSSSNVISASNFSIGLDPPNPGVLSLTPVPAPDATSVACSTLTGVNGATTSKIVITAADKDNALVNSGTVYIKVQWGTLDSSQCELVNGQCSVTWNSMTNIDKLTDTSDYDCYDLSTGTLDIANSITAWTYGEESFVDNDGDNMLSDAETYIDIEEPYLDRNDNNTFDAASDNIIDVTVVNGLHDPASTDYNGPNCDSTTRTDCGGAALIPIFTKISMFLD